MKIKNFLCIAMPFILAITSTSFLGQTTIYVADFESVGGYTTSITEDIDETTDYFGRIQYNIDTPSPNFSNVQGNFYFGAQDIDGITSNPNLPVSLSIDDVDVSGYTNLQLRVYLAEDGSSENWDATDFVHFTMDIDNSGSFTDILNIESSGGTNTAPAIDQNFDGIGNGTVITDTFTQFTSSISGVGSLLDLNIEFNLNDGGTDIAIDHIEIIGTASSVDTSVAFNTATSTVSEDGTSIDVCVSITNPDTSAATTVEVALNGGSTTANNPGDYTHSSAFTTTLTFPANSSTDQCVTINLTNDSDSESNETLVLDLQNAAGGNNATLGAITQHTLTITDDDTPNIIINEILADPLESGGVGVDANGDGVVSGDDDEFIELVNLDAFAHDLTGYTISDSSQTRYTFGSVSIPSGGSVVIFGGGTPVAIPGFSDTTSSLSLANSSDVITLRNSESTTITSYDYTSDDSGANQSIGRSNDSSGSFVKHISIGTNAVKASPGRTNVSGLPFNTLTWAGTTNNWETNSNWSSGSKPTATDDVIIPNGLSFYPTVETGVNAVANTITIENGATLKTEGTGTVSAGIIYNRSLTNGSQWYYMSSPVTGETYDENWANSNAILSGQNLNRGVSLYDNTSLDTDTDTDGPDTATGNWRYLQSDNSNGDTFNTGQGYGIIRNGSGVISFRGSGLHTTSQTTSITQGASTNFNMVGNPFTAYLNLGDFFSDNNSSTITGASAYFWNGSGYDTKLSGTDGTFEIAPGQGFFVEAASDATLTFDVADISHQNNETFQKSVRPEIELLLSDNKKSRYAKIYYIDGTTTGYDNGYDGKLFGGVTDSFELFTNLVSKNKGEKFQIQSLPNSDFESMIIPIGLTVASNKEISFTAKVSNLPSGINVYLEDRLTNTFTRLDDANNKYTVTLTEKSTDIGRFYLHTKSSSLSVENLDLNNISIYKTNNDNLKIVGLPQGKSTIKLFTILGKEVLNNSFNANGIKDISLPNLSAGIYIVQLNTQVGKLNKKITLE